jgi:hypothetical protein
MQPIKKIMEDSNLLRNERTPESERLLRSLEDRQKIITRQIIQMYLSARKELPAKDVIEYEVQVAMSELKEIPTGRLEESFLEAKVAAGAFLPSNGLIVKSYRAGFEKRHQDADKATKMENKRTYANHHSPQIESGFDTAAFFKDMDERTK